MGKGRGGRGGKGRGKASGKGKDRKKPDDSEDDDNPREEDGATYQSGGWNDNNAWDNGAQEWNGNDANYWQSGAHGYPSQPVSIVRPLAAQWRFANRVLQRLSPEERVLDVRRQVTLGDHVFVRYNWEHAEHHGVVVSVSDDAQGRRGGKGADDPIQVVHWAQDWLQRTPLSEFIRGGDLYRVTYPHWACQCWLPSSSTMKPYVVDEQYLEPKPDDEVAKLAIKSQRDGSWSPHWGQAPDLEWCLFVKSDCGGLPWEIHGRKAIASAVFAPIGCLIGGERRPSQAFGKNLGVPQSPTSAAKQGFSDIPEWEGEQAPSGSAQNWLGQGYDFNWGGQNQATTHQVSLAAAVPEPSMPPPAGPPAMPGAASNMSAAASEFVPGGADYARQNLAANNSDYANASSHHYPVAYQ